MKKEDNNKTPRLICYGYLSNTVYFVPDNLSLTIRVDSKKEKSPRKRKPTKARLAQIQEDKENFIWLFQKNQSDLNSFISSPWMNSKHGWNSHSSAEKRKVEADLPFHIFSQIADLSPECPEAVTFRFLWKRLTNRHTGFNRGDLSGTLRLSNLEKL